MRTRAREGVGIAREDVRADAYPEPSRRPRERFEEPRADEARAPRDEDAGAVDRSEVALGAREDRIGFRVRYQLALGSNARAPSSAIVAAMYRICGSSRPG